MGLSATQNAATKDLGAMFSAGHAAADRGPGSSSGIDTFGNLLSDRLQLDRTMQDAARRRADAQSTADDPGRAADISRKDAASAAPLNDQDATPADASVPAPVAATPATGAQDADSTKPAKATDVKDLDAAVQAAADPAAQLAAQIEAARQAAQQAAQQAIAAAPSLPATQSTGSVTGAAQPAGKSAAADAAALAALNASAAGTQDATEAAAQTQVGQGALPAATDGKEARPAAVTMSAGNTPTPPATPLPDGTALAQTLARTRAVADNTPPAVRQLGTASQAQAASGEHGLPRRADANPHGNVTQAATAAVADAGTQARDGGNAGTQTDSQGAGTQFQGILARAHGDASMAAPTFAVGNAGAANAAGGASVIPAQIHTLPTFGDAAWPQSMASQLAFMQVHRQSSAELQLNPAELGGLHVKLEVDNGVVNASFVCQHQAVAELVQDAMPRLRDAMQQGGMQLAQTSVSTGDFNQQQNAWQGASAQGNGSGNGGGGRFGGGAQNRSEAGAAAAAPSRISSHDGAIDTFA